MARRNAVIFFGHAAAGAGRTGVLGHGIRRDHFRVVEVGAQHAIHVGGRHFGELRASCRRAMQRPCTATASLHWNASPSIELPLNSSCEISRSFAACDEVVRHAGLRVVVDDRRAWLLSIASGCSVTGMPPNAMPIAGLRIRLNLELCEQRLTFVRHRAESTALAVEHVGQNLSGGVVRTVVPGNAIAEQHDRVRLIRRVVIDRGGERRQLYRQARRKLCRREDRRTAP